jgi:hypothetical protein
MILCIVFFSTTYNIKSTNDWEDFFNGKMSKSKLVWLEHSTVYLEGFEQS